MVSALNLRRLLPFFVLIAGLILGISITSFLQGVSRLGFRIPQPDMVSDYLTAVIWAISLAALLFAVPASRGDRKALLWLWFAKCMVTLFAMLFYENHYGLDAYGYFDAARPTFFDWKHVEYGEGSSIIAAFTWYLNHSFPINDSYHALKVFFSFVGLLGIFIFYRGTVLYTGIERRKHLYFLGLFPSILFWSSILGKDPINLFGICIYLYGVFGWSKKPSAVYVVIMLFGLSISCAIRLWTGLIFLAPFAFLGVGQVKNIVAKFILIAVFAGGGAFAVQSVTAKFGVESTESALTATNAMSRSWSHGGSGQKAPELKSISQILAFAPVGMFAALFRPLPGEVMNPFGLFSGLENFFLLYLLYKATRRGWRKAFKERLVLWSFLLVVIWAFLYSFISYQNLGSAVRFKLQILPMMITLFLYVGRIQPREEREDSPEQSRLLSTAR